jgi:GT2 family glycosyltransferase
MKISFCIPSKNNLRYLKHAIHYIQKNIGEIDYEILVWIDKNEDGTYEWLESVRPKNVRWWLNPKQNPFGIGNAYDFLVENADSELIMIYHADMIMGKHCIQYLLEYVKKGVVVSATRVEPPLHPPSADKITLDFGLWPETDIEDGFREEDFEEFCVSNTFNNFETTNGIFAPWLMYKSDYIGHDPALNSLAEDMDIFLRMKLKGYEFIQPRVALVYHLTCRGGQFEHAVNTEDLRTRSREWEWLSINKTREFIRKWKHTPLLDKVGHPIEIPRYQMGVKVINTNTDWLWLFDLYFDKVYLENQSMNVKLATDRYLNFESQNTATNLYTKFSNTEQSVKDCDIYIEIDCNILNTQSHPQFFAELPFHIKKYGIEGKKMKALDILFKFNKLTERQKEYIYIK